MSPFNEPRDAVVFFIGLLVVCFAMVVVGIALTALGFLVWPWIEALAPLIEAYHSWVHNLIVGG